MIEYFVILTMVIPGVNQVDYSTLASVESFPADTSREEIFRWMFGRMPEDIQRGTVAFFSAEPNRPSTDVPVEVPS